MRVSCSRSRRQRLQLRKGAAGSSRRPVRHRAAGRRRRPAGLPPLGRGRVERPCQSFLECSLSNPCWCGGKPLPGAGRAKHLVRDLLCRSSARALSDRWARLVRTSDRAHWRSDAQCPVPRRVTAAGALGARARLLSLSPRASGDDRRDDRRHGRRSHRAAGGDGTGPELGPAVVDPGRPVGARRSEGPRGSRARSRGPGAAVRGGTCPFCASIAVGRGVARACVS